ncbi:helix-turn-helix domain-containing protein [Parachitinimonas caeni]|uniref:Helix-turn-helix transcriptional regulator n=1 Tax=Parachitinimonas caeni TaxID=3031301 RepID=A0ABT7DYZ1_9NEIS|nr:helix-turn-helix transcriptional regulator [Parachitinimonas caeni]MDK2125280.1 helix-turn-helix transcriptional regulator [Parachitinimonas caeni]
MSDFASRLRELIGDQPLSVFSRRVSLSESLLRKYLTGSEPSLGRASQIARATGCSLEWLATGDGERNRQTEAIDLDALELAASLTFDRLGNMTNVHHEPRAMKLVIALYQYLQATRLEDGGYDRVAARNFLGYLSSLCGL